MTESSKLSSPPYIAYPSFKNTVRRFKDIGLPTHIDSSVFPTLSGSTRAQFMLALKFLSLLEANGAPTDKLRRLSQANDAEWRKEMGQLLHQHYPKQIPILANGTLTQLKSSFGDEMGGMSILTPAMRFLVAASKDCGLTVAPHIEKIPGKPRKAPKMRGTESISSEQTPLAQPQTQPANPTHGSTSFQAALLAKFPEFNPSWDEEQQKAWFAAYQKLLALAGNSQDEGTAKQ